MHKDQHLATIEDIAAAHRILLRRPCTLAGFAHFLPFVERGTPLSQFVNMFTISDEYRQRIAAESEVTTVDLGGYVVCVSPSEQDIGRQLVQTKSYEPYVRDALTGLLREGQTFVDIGANVGIHSFLAAKIVGERGAVIAVEPYPSNVQLLYEGILRNNLSNMRVIPNAASDRSTVFSLNGGTSDAYVAPAESRRYGVAYTQSIVLDEALASLPAIDVVKIDIEGHEPLALKGFAGLLRKHKPALVTEFSPYCLKTIQGLDPREYVEQLLSYYTHLRVISWFGDDASFTTASDLVKYWQRRDRELTDQKTILEGTLHFDIIATNG